MSTDAKALTIVEAALEIEDPQARAAFVSQACGEDEALRAHVERMLALDREDVRLLPTESFVRPLGLIEAIPDRIGPYRVTGELARGGMGAVVRAERDDGVFQQQVAIKLIRGDLASDRAKARFAEERRILARLRHPGIVRILDGGEAEGRPWLAMDYVEGLPVTEALRVAGASRDVRLDAFEAVCEAVAYAHRSFVIHADIKPSNVLMTADRSVHLLDFGIARLILAIDSDEQGDPYPLTKGYAAPERGVGVAPTVASDVFSLGMLLLAMLGVPAPVEGTAFVPGARLPQDALTGDLAAIAARALAERPEARYPDVPALLDDLRRMRASLPVRARGDAGWRYLLSRFTRRHRRALAIAGVVGLVLLSTSVVSTWQYVRAEHARAEADARFIELRALARFMLFELYDRLADAPGTVAARERLAATAGAYLDRLRAAPGAPADLRLDTARGYRRLAEIEGLSGTANLGRPDLAQRALDKADALLAPLAKERPNDPGVLVEQGWVAISRWTVASDVRGPALTQAARGAFARALERDPGNAEALLGALTTERDNAVDLIQADRPAEALKVLRPALARLRAARLPADLADKALLLETSLLGRIGDATYYKGDMPGSLAPYREQEQLVLGQLARGPSVRWEEKLAEARYNVAGTLGAMPGRQEEALAVTREGVERLRRVLATGQDAALEVRLTILLGEESILLDALGRTGEAAAVSREHVAISEARLATQPGDPTRRRDLAVMLAAHAGLLGRSGDRAGACAAVRQGVGLLDSLAASGDLGAKDRRMEYAKFEAPRRLYCP